MHGTLLRPGRVEALAEVIRALAAEKESLENESR
jgi:hypothetical protein